jgi:hypothetical protein
MVDLGSLSNDRKPSEIRRSDLVINCPSPTEAAMLPRFAPTTQVIRNYFYPSWAARTIRACCLRPADKSHSAVASGNT